MSSVDGGSGWGARPQRCQLQPCAESQHGGGVQPARLGVAAKWAKFRRKSRPRPHRRPRAQPRQPLSLTFPKTRVRAQWRAPASRTPLSHAPVPRAAPHAMLPAEEAGGAQGHRRPRAPAAMSFAARGRRSTRTGASSPPIKTKPECLAAILCWKRHPRNRVLISDRVWKTVGGAHKAGVDASGRQYLFSSSRRIHSTGNSGAHVSLVLGSRARRAEPRCGRANLGRRWRSGARGAEKKGSAVPLPVLASRGGDAQSLGAHGRSL